MAEREQTRALFERFAVAAPTERHAIRDQLVTQHLPLAASAARRYVKPGQPNPPVPYEDLVQVACCGLLEAFDRYDPARSAFASFAWVTMTGLIRRHLRDHGWSVRPPRAVQEAANVLRHSWPGLAQEVGRIPTTADVATYLGWTHDTVHTARTAELALHAASTEELTALGWQPAQPSEQASNRSAEWHQVETRLLLGRALQTLTDQERNLLQLRYVDDLTQVQIAALTGVSQMEVSRRLARLMAKMRATIGEPDDAPISRSLGVVRRRARTHPIPGTE